MFSNLSISLQPEKEGSPDSSISKDWRTESWWGLCHSVFSVILSSYYVKVGSIAGVMLPLGPITSSSVSGPFWVLYSVCWELTGSSTGIMPTPETFWLILFPASDFLHVWMWLTLLNIWRRFWRTYNSTTLPFQLCLFLLFPKPNSHSIGSI